jgi:enamine deaminase RidA (YjgF/YER057c/UK114 family)
MAQYFQPETALGAYYQQRGFSQAVVLPPNARLVIASGLPGFSESQKSIVTSSPRDQIAACYQNCDLALKTAGVEKGLLAAHKVHVFLTNVEDIPLVMPVWKELYGEEHRPAWMTFAGAKFGAEGMLVEIQVEAHIMS